MRASARRSRRSASGSRARRATVRCASTRPSLRSRTRSSCVTSTGRTSALRGARRPDAHRRAAAELPRGPYTVRWQAMSNDGHVVSGVYTFGVGVPAPPSTEASARPGPTRTEDLVRWAYFLGLALLVGGLGFRLLVVRGPLPARAERASTGCGLGAVVVLEAGLVAFLLAGRMRCSFRSGDFSTATSRRSRAGRASAWRSSRWSSASRSSPRCSFSPGSPTGACCSGRCSRSRSSSRRALALGPFGRRRGLLVDVGARGLGAPRRRASGSAAWSSSRSSGRPRRSCGAGVPALRAARAGPDRAAPRGRHVPEHPAPAARVRSVDAGLRPRAAREARARVGCARMGRRAPHVRAARWWSADHTARGQALSQPARRFTCR